MVEVTPERVEATRSTSHLMFTRKPPTCSIRSRKVGKKKDHDEHTVSFRFESKPYAYYYACLDSALAEQKKITGLIAAGEEYLRAYIEERKPKPKGPPPMPKHECSTVEYLVEKVVEERNKLAKQDDKHRRNAETVRSHLRRFAEKVKGNIEDVRVDEIERFLDKQKVSPKTRDNMRVSIVVLFSYAQRRGYLPPLPYVHAASCVSRPPSIARVKPREVYTPEELTRLLAFADSRLVPYIVLGAFAGLRSAERERMKWAAFRPEQRAIVLEAEITKTSRRRSIEVSPNLQSWLTLFAGESADPIQPLYDIHRFIRVATTSAGISPKQNSLRISFIAYSIEKGGNMERTAKHAGHSVEILEREYLHLASRVDAEAWFQITPASVLQYVASAGLPRPEWAYRATPVHGPEEFPDAEIAA